MEIKNIYFTVILHPADEYEYVRFRNRVTGKGVHFQKDKIDEAIKVLQDTKVMLEGKDSG